MELLAHGYTTHTVYMCRDYRRLQIVSVGARVGVLLGNNASLLARLQTNGM